MSSTAWVWHRLRNVPFRIEQPADTKWGQDYRGIENWVRPMVDTETVPPNAYQWDLLRTPGWQVATAGPPPPYAMTCRTAVAGHATDVVIDTLGAPVNLGPAHVSAYNGYAYVKIGRDSVMRVRAAIFNDALPPAEFLRVLSHIVAADSAP